MADVTPEQFTEYMKNPLLFPDDFKDWISDWFAINVPKLHVSQIYGFKLHSVKSATEITANEAVTSTSYGNLTTSGPTLTDIPNGFYIAFFGASFGRDFGAGFSGFDNVYTVYMSPSIDGATPLDNDAALLNAGSGGRAVLLDLSSGTTNHSLLMQYKVSPSSPSPNCQVRYRWLHLIKVITEEGNI